LKQRLLTMLEWHARALHGLEHDTWHDGRYIEEWADRHALAALPHTFGAYERADLRRALSATLELFNTLAQDTAARLCFAYPGASRAQAISWLTQELTLQQ
jgi:aminoglycoside 6-adenylyltransferase